MSERSGNHAAERTRVDHFTCNLCECLCGLSIESRAGRIERVKGNPEDVFSRGHICPKAHGLKELADDPDRIRTPLVREGEGFRAASWDEALDLSAERLGAVRRRHGRDSVALYVGNPVAASNGSQLVLGDPARRFQALRERGGSVVLIDPRRTESAKRCSEHHFIRPGADAALLLAMLWTAFEEGLVDASRVAELAGGLAELGVAARRFSPARVAPAVGMDASLIRQLARRFFAAESACAYARVGVCQNAFGPVAMWLVEALNIVSGNFDRAGGAMFPSPAFDIAPLGRLLVGNNHARWCSRVRGLPEFLGALPSSVMAEEMDQPGPGQIHALVCLAGNPVLSTPNGARLGRSLERLEFMLAIDYYHNETTRHADVILPSKHVFETGNYDALISRFTVRNVAKYSAPFIDLGDDTRDDWQIAVELLCRWFVPSAALRSLARTAAADLPEYVIDLLLRVGSARLSLAELRRRPHGVDLGPLQPGRERNVNTPGRRARLAPPALIADLARLEAWLEGWSDGELSLIGRRHLRSNNSWMHNLPALAKGPERATLMMHPRDAERRGLKNGCRVCVKSRVGSVTATLQVTDEVMPGVVSLPHGFGHAENREGQRVASTLAGPNANALTDELLVEPVLGTSILNGVPVSVSPSD